MADATEDKKEDKTSADASQQEKESDKQESEKTDSQADGGTNNQIDYAAELEKAQAQLSQAEHTIIDLRRKKPEQKEEGSVDEDAVDEKIKAGLSEGLSQIQQQLASTAIASTLAGMSSDPDERKLIMFHYNNSIKQTGITPESIVQDLENAQILANRRKLLRENTEIKRAITTQNTISNGGRGSNQDKEEVQEQGPKLTAAEIALLARRGLKPSDVKTK